MFKKPSYLVFAICSFLICIPLAFYYARTYEFVSLWPSADRAGVMALGQVSEIFFMALVPFFLKRLGVKRMLLGRNVGLGTSIRFIRTDAPRPAMLVFGIVLHGICYDFFFVTGQLYTDRVAPKEIRTSAQALIGLLTYGAGMLVGNLIHGPWGDYIGLDPKTTEGWAAGAGQFLADAGRTRVRRFRVFFLTFWDRSSAAGGVDEAPAGADPHKVPPQAPAVTAAAEIAIF